MLGGEVELAVARMEMRDARIVQRLHFIRNGPGSAEPHRAPSAHRLGAIQAPLVAPPLGLEAPHTPFMEVTKVVHHTSPRPIPGMEISLPGGIPPVHISIKPDQSGYVRGRLPSLEARNQFRERLFSVAPDAEIHRTAFQNRLRNYGEPNSTENERRIRSRADLIHYCLHSPHDEVLAGEVAIVGVAKRHANHHGRNVLQAVPNGGADIVCKAKVEHAGAIPAPLQPIRQIVQPDGRDRRLHLIGVNEQNRRPAHASPRVQRPKAESPHSG